MMRVLIDLTDEQIADLAKLCDSAQLSRAAVVRQAVSAYLVEHKQENQQEAFGLWQTHPTLVDGLSYQNTLRDEW